MDRLMDRAVELGMSAMALTDHGNLFGTINFIKQAEKRGIKPIIGCEGYMVTDHKNDEKPGRENHKSYHLGMLAKDYEGYQNLSKVVSMLMSTVFIIVRVRTETLAEHAKGLIAFTGCMQGWVLQLILHGQEGEAEKAMGQMIEIFGKENYFVELHNHGIEEQAQLVRTLKLAKKLMSKLLHPMMFTMCRETIGHPMMLCFAYKQVQN